MCGEQISADTARAKAVIVTGAEGGRSAQGETFIGSALLPKMRWAATKSVREGAQIIEEMLRFPLPVIAAVNGAAPVGLGCGVRPSSATS